MSFVYGDSFDSYTAANDPILAGLQYRYHIFLVDPSSNHIVAGAGRDGTQALYGAGNGGLSRGVPGTAVPYTVHMAVKRPSEARATILSFIDSFHPAPFLGTQVQVSLVIASNGSLVLTTGGLVLNEIQATQFGPETAPNLVMVNTWTHIAVKVLCHPTAGAVNVWVNGSLVVNLTGVATQNAGFVEHSIAPNIDEIAIGTPYWYYDDFIVTNDTDSGDGCIGFLGDLIGEKVGPTSDVAAGWSRNTGSTNASCVDDAAPDGDATYVYSDALNALDLYGMGALARIEDGIKAVQVSSVAKKTSGGTRAIAHAVRVGGTDYLGSNQYLPTDYAGQETVFALNPDTSASWSAAAVNAAAVGQRVTV
jgi:hypothetical protein